MYYSTARVFIRTLAILLFFAPVLFALGQLFMDKPTYTLEIEPRPTPRPRLGRYGVYNHPAYTDYKRNLMWLLKSKSIPIKDYDSIHARFYFTYPKKTAKKNRIDNAPMRKKCDCDNLVKGLLDALESVKVINNDRQFYSIFVEKFYTCKEKGYIEFELNEVLIKI